MPGGKNARLDAAAGGDDGTSDKRDDDAPDAETCGRLCDQFAEVTGTDDACGHFFLQDVNWNLETSLSSFTLLSWNIDGLDTANLTTRTKAVATIIIDKKPDIIFLQEVVPEGYCILDSYLSDRYLFVSGSSTGHYASGYFTAALLKKSVFTLDESTVDSFPDSLMERTLLTLKTKVGATPLQLLVTHLESTKAHAGQRMAQLKVCFKRIADAPPGCLVVFGGDLNIRDEEIDRCGGIPARTADAWAVCGSQASTRYTWDCLKNDNKHFDKFKPRCRFDRLVYTTDAGFTASDLQLVGTERIKTTLCFPSDHFGLLVRFTRTVATGEAL